jgi:hypothetical protein
MRSRLDFSPLVLSFLLSGMAAAAPADLSPDKESSTRPRPVTVTHRADEGDWAVASTDNFLIYHRRSRAFVEKVAQTAERTREAQNRRWFGGGDDWSPRCRIYLYTDPEEYSAATGAPPHSPGHTRIDGEGERIFGRTIHLHGDGPELVRAVLPHEVTHAVVAGRFGARVPRWADEGIAVLSEPRERVDAHLRWLPRWRDDGRLVPIRRLLHQEEYPDPRTLGSFYAQSVSLVDFLVSARGAAEFAEFLREGLRDGYAPALRRHYGWSWAELERRWREHAFPEAP